MIVAYSMVGHDNGAHFFEEISTSCFCSNCRCLVDEKYKPDHLVGLKKNIDDLSSTYDGRDIASLRFKKFCERMSLTEVIFSLVNQDPKLYLIEPTSELVFDVKRRKTKFEGYCSVCGKYQQVAGATPGFLKNICKPIKEGVYRTDVEFGSCIGKNKIIIVGVDTKEQIVKEGLSGVVFKPVYGECEKVMINGIEW